MDLVPDHKWVTFEKKYFLPLEKLFLNEGFPHKVRNKSVNFSMLYCQATGTGDGTWDGDRNGKGDVTFESVLSPYFGQGLKLGQ